MYKNFFYDLKVNGIRWNIVVVGSFKNYGTLEWGEEKYWFCTFKNRWGWSKHPHSISYECTPKDISHFMVLLQFDNDLNNSRLNFSLWNECTEKIKNEKENFIKWNIFCMSCNTFCKRRNWKISFCREEMVCIWKVWMCRIKGKISSIFLGFTIIKNFEEHAKSTEHKLIMHRKFWARDNFHWTLFKSQLWNKVESVFCILTRNFDGFSV